MEERCCIIGFDALEYTILHGGKYPSLKQIECGKVRLNVYPLNTEMIWASFITGEKPEKHGVRARLRLNKPFAETLQKLSLKLGFYRFLQSKKDTVLDTLGLLKRAHTKESFRVPTIFDFVDKAIPLGIPAYNEWPNCIMLRGRIHDAIGNPAKGKELAKKAWAEFQLKMERTLKLLESDWDLFMVHFYIADIMQHIWWYKRDIIADLYQKLNETAKEIKMKLNDEVFILMVSDHGLLNGYHTPYAFYSSNIVLNLENPKITDFADIIMQRLGIPSKHETEKIKKRLRSLGYSAGAG